MKQSALLTSFIAGSLLLTACGNESSSDKKENKTEQTKQTVDLSKETEAYKAFTVDQIDHFVKDTEKFVNAFKAGDIAKAKEIYPKARMYFERSEPVAESFGDLDPRIDARLADMKAEGKTKEWSGYHKLEKALWEENTTKGYEATADQLLKDAKELRAKVDTAEVTPKLMLQGSIDLLNEVSTSKISGEEEIYSHTDLYDFKANIEGAEKIFELFKEKISKKDDKLAQDIQKRFDNVNTLLKQHETPDGGYVSYEQLSKEDTKKLSEAVDQLGEPLSQMAIILE
ncbi:iron uptake system protein EfeO [Macrococcoides caseolyticum]|uniref:iron uptake system protein EfeO n=1 Tax=Macrococcoides caseolyticum TaxID=69966 RepID=UPI0030EDE1C6